MTMYTLITVHVQRVIANTVDYILFYVCLQLIYGYVQTGDNDETETVLHFKDKGSVTSHTT